MTKLKIKVTKDILERSKWCTNKGSNSAGYSCAISLAVRDIFPDAFVGGNRIYANGLEAEKLKTIELPQKAQIFITEFDTTMPVRRPLMPEIEFEVEVPDEVLEDIDIEEVKKVLENHPTLELV